LRLLKNGERLLRGEFIIEIREVERGDDLLGREFEQ